MFPCETKKMEKLLKFRSVFLIRNMYIYDTPLKFKNIQTRDLISLSSTCFKLSYIYTFYTIKQKRLWS